MPKFKRLGLILDIHLGSVILLGFEPKTHSLEALLFQPIIPWLIDVYMFVIFRYKVKHKV